MKKDHIILVKIFLLLLFFTPQQAFAEIFLFPDWNYYKYRNLYETFENNNIKTFGYIRNKYTFDNFFDEQKIFIYKKSEKISPNEIGKAYLARTLIGDKKAEKYIIKDTENDFIAIFCSQNLKRCEIVRFLNGFDGHVEIKYIHNNIWHFQNNIGSFVEVQNRIKIYPDLLIYRICGDKIYTRI